MSSHLTKEERLLLIEEVYQTFLDGTETFEDRIGVGLAYLLGEISRDGAFDDLPDSVYYDEFMNKLRDLFPKDHVVWLFVKSDPLDCPDCELPLEGSGVDDGCDCEDQSLEARQERALRAKNP